MTAAGEAPRRRCIATGAVAEKAALLRFVVGPDGAIVPDVAGRLPGRGIWVAADRAALRRAVRRNLFARAARRQVCVDPELPELVERLLRRRCLELLGLARRAGQVVAGFEKVRALLRAGRAVALIEAADAAEGGRAKLRPLAGGLPVVALYTAAELGLALGRENVVHAALTRGGLAQRFVTDSDRLAGVRDATPERDGASPPGETTT